MLPRFRFPSLLLFGLLVFCAPELHAHHLPPGMEDIDEFEDGAAFIAGLRHPMLGMSHWLFALTIGALAGSRLRGGIKLAGGLAAGLSVGAALGLQQIVMPLATIGTLLVAVVPLLLLVLGNRLSNRAALSWVVAAALWQGNEHGIAWPMEAAAMPYLIGILSATVTLIAAGAGAALLARRSRSFRNPFAATR